MISDLIWNKKPPRIRKNFLQRPKSMGGMALRHLRQGLRGRELEVSRQNIQQRIQDRDKDVKVRQQQVEAINHSADEAVEDSEKIFTELVL
ncbi:hypothetical protein GBF38_019065 [Nibea albiflora]|uniref:Uncharacterized protein n=1 Tax=Nibea albiflora TaxID=240163 RepID=A0ACB7F6B2_NIBAL|nr:hypothetical protein GBF38_019065 [Nibea albiflora]